MPTTKILIVGLVNPTYLIILSFWGWKVQPFNPLTIQLTIIIFLGKETVAFPSPRGRARVGVNTSTLQSFIPSTNTPPHPNPLPQGEGACNDSLVILQPMIAYPPTYLPTFRYPLAFRNHPTLTLPVNGREQIVGWAYLPNINLKSPPHPNPLP